jgi:acyl carrier protein
VSEAKLEDLVKSALVRVAPDLDGLEVVPDERFRDQFEIDSMDMLNFVIALHRATGMEIPERDYTKLETLSGCVAYLKAKGLG